MSGFRLNLIKYPSMIDTCQQSSIASKWPCAHSKAASPPIAELGGCFFSPLGWCESNIWASPSHNVITLIPNAAMFNDCTVNLMSFQQPDLNQSAPQSSSFMWVSNPLNPDYEFFKFF
jgi:hypothetical protein